MLARPLKSPAMVEAGVYVIAEEYPVCGADIAPDLARDVSMAMWAQGQKEPGKNSSNS